MGEVVVLSSDEGTTMEKSMMSRGKSSEVVRWEKYLPTTVLRVLLVESDDSTRQIITALLQKCSYKVVAVSDGLDAWETLKEKKTHNIDVILTELDLPSISGFALLALVMEDEACKHIPVIMMSSQDSMTMVLKCMLRGAADYLIKPMRKNELKNLWQHVWRRLTLRGGDHTANGPSLPASQQNLEATDETCADSRYHSDHGSGSQAISGDDKLMEDVKPLVESFDVTMDLIGGIDKQTECCYYGDNTGEQQVGPELGLSLKRCCSGGNLEKNQDESKHQKLSLSGASAFSRYENDKLAEKEVAVVVDASSSGEPKTPSESHEKILRSDHGSATTSSNHENVGSSSVSGQNQFLQSRTRKQKQESLVPVESNSVKASKEVEVGCQSTNEGTVTTAGGQSRSSITEKSKEEEEEEEEGDGVTAKQRRSERAAALMKFRMKRKDRCFNKKVRYESRKKLAEQRPRVKGQFVRAVNSDASCTK